MEGYVKTYYGWLPGCSICGIIALGGPLLCEHGVTPQPEITISGHVDFVPDESFRRFINGK